MRATKKVKEVILARRMQHWFDRATSPALSNDEQINARRNYWRLVRGNPQIAKKHGFTEVKVLERAA